MKELKVKLSRYLSAVLMVAMVITSTPQAAMAAVEADPLAGPIVDTISDGTDGENQDVSQPDVEEPEQEVENIDGEEEPVEEPLASVEPQAVVEPSGTVSCSVTFDNPAGVSVNVTKPSEFVFNDKTKTIVSDDIEFTVTSPDPENCEITVGCSTNNDAGDLVFTDGKYVFRNVSESDFSTITIKVKWKVSFNLIGATVSYNTTGADDAYVAYSSGDVSVSTNATIFFKVTPVAGYKTPISVSANGKPLAETEIYSQAITAGTEFSVKATPICHTVSFNTTGVEVEYSTVSAGNYKKYDGTPVSVPNGEIYYKLTPTEGYEAPFTSLSDSAKNTSDTGVFSITSGLGEYGTTTIIDVSATPMNTVSFKTDGAVVTYDTVSTNRLPDGSFSKIANEAIFIAKDSKLWFDVKPATNYTKPITVSDGNKPATSENGIYYAEVKDGKDHEIDVTATPIMYTVSFDCVSDNFDADAGIRYTVINEHPSNKYVYNQSLGVQQGKTVKFLFKLANAYEKPVVKVGDVILKEDTNHMYSCVITKDTIISITTTKKATVSFNLADESPFDKIYYAYGSEFDPDDDDDDIEDCYLYEGTEVPVTAGDIFYYKFVLDGKYDAESLSVTIDGDEQTPNRNGVYQKSCITRDTIIKATAKVKTSDIAFENPTEAVIETISGASVPSASFKDKTKKFAVDMNDEVKFKVTLSGNYVGRAVSVVAFDENNNIVASLTLNGEVYSVIANRVKTIAVLPRVNYTFTNSGNTIEFEGDYPSVEPSSAATISKNGIESGVDYYFKVTPDAGKTIDYVKIDGKEVAAVAKDATSSIYKVNARVDTAIEVQSDTKYTVTFDADNGAVAKVGKDKKDTNYSETLSDNNIKVLAGAQEFKFKVQAADSYRIASVSVDKVAALAADKDGVYTISANGVTKNPKVIIKSEKQNHKVAFVNKQKAEIKYEIGDTVSEGSTNIINTKSGAIAKAVVGTTFMVEAPEGSQVMAVVRGKDKEKATEMKPSDKGIYTIDSLNADETITVTCRKNATGIKFGKSALSENEIDQTANTVVTYKMSVLGVDKNFDPETDLSLDVKSANGSVSMTKVNNKIINVKVTTPYEYSGDDKADVEFVISEGKQVLSTFKVTATLPEIEAPSVAVSDIRDDSAVLTLTDKSKQVVNEGNVYYHISATQQVSEDKIDTIDLAALNNTLITEKGAFAVGKDIYVPADKESKTFATKVEVNFRAFVDDLAASTGYNVSVNACIAKDGGNNKVLDGSPSTMLKKNFNLNAAKYETNLKLGKAATKYITTQAGIPIAKITWSKDTTYREFDSIYVYGGKQTIDYDNLVVRDDIIYLEDDVELKYAGTYTVVAQPKSKNSNVKATTLKFKVVQGIEFLSSHNTEISILREKGKKVIYQLPELIYNGGVTKPASKKVTYTLSRGDGANLTANDKLIKVAKGKVTIAKDYVFDAENPVSYNVMVKANDFAENTTEMPSPYTFKIKETGTTPLKYLYICKLVDNQCRPVDTSVAIGSDENYKYYLIATKEKAGKVITYNSKNIIETSEYSLKSSNANVSLYSEHSAEWEGLAYAIEPTAYAKNVTFTATAVDGSKTKLSLKKVTFEDYAEDLWLEVYSATSYAIGEGADSTRTLKTLNNEAFRVNDYVKFVGIDTPEELWDEGDDGDDYYPLIDYKVKVDNGLKIVNNANGWRNVIFTGKKLTKDFKATGTLTYTYYKLVKGERVKTTKKLTITNTNKWIKVAAPSAKQVDTLYAVKTSPQSISFNVATKKLPTLTNMVRITPVADNMNSSYQNLYDTSTLKTGEKINEISITDGSFNLGLVTYGFRWDSREGKYYECPIEAGTYKYIITYGHKDASGEFIEDTGATTLAIKVTEEKAKVATAYTLSEVNPSVAITGKFTKGTTVSGTELLNANIRGTINKFNDYFELSADGKSIELKAAKGIANEGGLGIDTEKEAKALQDAIEYLTNKANKNDLVGYLAYDVDHSLLTDTIKITMKVVTNATSAKAFKAGKKTVPVSGGNIELKYNKQDTKYAFAYTDAGNDSVSLNAAVDHKGDVIISGKNAEETGTVKGVYVYVLKADSPYATYINGITDATKKQYAIESYCVKVKLGDIKVVK